MLRHIFKSKFTVKNDVWIDSQQWEEKWCSKLNDKTIKLLKNGDITKWDSTLLFHMLLYSSQCPFADRVGNIRLRRNSTIDHVQLKDKVEKNRTIIIDISNSQFFCKVTKCESVSHGHRVFFIPIPWKQSWQGQIEADVYVCQNEWHYIQDLSFKRNGYFAHYTNAKITTGILKNVVSDIKGTYRKLQVDNWYFSGLEKNLTGKINIT